MSGAGRRASAVLICAKCTRRLGGGFGPRRRTPLARALRKRLGLWPWSRAGIAEVECMGVCPRGGVTVINRAGGREWLIVPAGVDIDTVAAELGLTGA